MQRGYFRGHPIIWKDKQWIYEDTREPLPATGGKTRPCIKCETLTSLDEGEVDPCLGVLLGVDNACCGHGVREKAYIRFTNGVVIKSFIVERPNR